MAALLPSTRLQELYQVARELCKPNQQALFSLELNIVAFRELEGVQEVQILVGRQLN